MEQTITILTIVIVINIAITLWLWKGLAVLYNIAECTHHMLHDQQETEGERNDLLQNILERYMDKKSREVAAWDDATGENDTSI